MVFSVSSLQQLLSPSRLASACLLPVLAFAPVPCVAQTAETDTINDPSFVWEVETPTNSVYLLGAAHLLNDQYYPLPTAMEEAFADAEVVVFEADVSAASEIEAAMVLLEKAQPEPGETLEEVLSPETYALAQQHLQEVGLPIELFRLMEPWFLAISLTSSKLVSLGFTPEDGIDSYFRDRARAAEKPVLFLETLEQQADLFEQLSVEEQRQFTQQTLEEVDLIERSFTDIVDAWSQGDDDRMAEILLASFEDYPEMEAIFVRDRNQRWLQQIEPYLHADQDYLVVVGALHLVGPDGLLALLEQQGYEAEQR